MAFRCPSWPCAFEEASSGTPGVADPFHEIGAVGEIKIVRTGRDRGANQPIRVLAVGLERPGRIDDDVGRELVQQTLQIAVAIDDQCRDLRPFWQRVDEQLGPFERPPANDQVKPRIARQQQRQPAAKNAVAANDQELQLTLNPARNRPA